jgi:lysozyme
MRKMIAWSLILVGGLLGIVWYFDINQAGEDWSDVFSDPLGTIKDLFLRGVAIVQGKTSDDPRTIATGIIAGFEGFVGHSYQDAVGVWTIGYGHKIVSGDGFQKDRSQAISQEDAFALLQADLESAASAVDNLVQVQLTPNQLAALYSFAFNEGVGAFQQSTLLQKINNEDLSGAVAEFSRWVYAGNPKQVLQALVNRRADEASLFGSDISKDLNSDQGENA